ncbi:type III-B CRISPR-associated protein Cas10/Cmr2 [Thiomicrospira sp. R3]|uniref:type III-B CRISPR-associated protein Cas10/Cmr2 n=1 Tax=Thiomicrospira sp. R3 TaxID=3035472 RepID=UPI00259B74E6|nr:type III-B CRISPR-associated protein Cas10/Cmr2 [Thiomicrospira sp. R3]WFE68511.1 type III-B CRISPR-associated protein Cas10/Cmr2 [Thiomicrospira sp. R3]
MSDLNTHQFHFTIGPVQGFVAQARRTRDFWAGSFILSWLAGCAMVATRNQGGEIQFPAPDEDFINAIKNGQSGPTQGTLPNRFKALVDAEFNPQHVIQQMNQAWLTLAEKVYQADIADKANPKTREIWQRQVEGFFEVSWVMTEADDNRPLLDMRKNWRHHFPHTESGHKCSLMEGWQELSGIEGFYASDNKKRKNFWQAIQSKIGTRDLIENEALCALSFIKRRFAYHFEQVKLVGFNGWKLEPRNVPSVALLAAMPVLKSIQPSPELEKFKQAWSEAGGQKGETKSLPKALRTKTDLGLDGIAWFSNTYENPTSYGLNKEKIPTAKQALTALYQSQNLKEPSPFYAILMMDGDSLGKQMSDPSKQPLITAGLNKFTSGVKEVVDQHDGFLIYAGGDDVLAILTLETALDCAVALRQSYIDSFLNLTGHEQLTTSISAAIIYAHIKTPLSKILHDSHHVLDEAAKDQAGRDALAVQVVKQSGKHLLWAQPWQQAFDEQGALKIEKLAKQFAGQSTAQQLDGDALEASTKFFYGIREYFNRLIDAKKPFNQDDAQLIGDLLAVDYIKSGVNNVKEIEIAKQRIQPLLAQCTPHKRNDEVSVNRLAQAEISVIGAPQIDGALLVRFLAFHGRDIRGQNQ